MPETQESTKQPCLGMTTKGIHVGSDPQTEVNEVEANIETKAEKPKRKRKPHWTKRQRSKRNEPLSLSVIDSLEIIPIGKTRFYELLMNGTIKSEMRFGV